MDAGIKAFARATGIRNVPALRDAIVAEYGTDAMAAAEKAGLGDELRNGIAESVRRLLKHDENEDKRERSSASAGQADFSAVCPGFERMRPAYYVESRDEYVSREELVGDLPLLDEARSHLRKKMEECRREVELLDEIYAFLAESRHRA